MKKILLASFLAIISIFLSCRKKSAENIPTQVWQNVLNNGKDFFSIVPVKYKKSLICGVDQDSNVVKLYSLDKSNGQKQWEWMSRGFTAENFGSTREAYLYNNVLVLITNVAVYGIDLDTGTEKWHKTYYKVFARIIGKNENAFIHTYDINGISRIESINVNTGQSNVLQDGAVSQSRETRFAVDIANTNILSIVYPKDSGGVVPSKLICHNGLTRQKIYEKNIPIGFSSILDTDENYIYISGLKSVGLFDIKTGELKKKVDVDVQYLPSRASVFDGKLYVSGSSIMCYDIDENKQLWNYAGSTSGSLYKFWLHNGVIYFSDSNLFALDALTGEQIWKYGSKFSPQMIFDAEDNRIYSCKYNSINCYEAAR